MPQEWTGISKLCTVLAPLHIGYNGYNGYLLIITITLHIHYIHYNGYIDYLLIVTYCCTLYWLKGLQRVYKGGQPAATYVGLIGIAGSASVK